MAGQPLGHGSSARGAARLHHGLDPFCRRARQGLVAGGDAAARTAHRVLGKRKGDFCAPPGCRTRYGRLCFVSRRDDGVLVQPAARHPRAELGPGSRQPRARQAGGPCSWPAFPTHSAPPPPSSGPAIPVRQDIASLSCAGAALRRTRRRPQASRRRRQPGRASPEHGRSRGPRAHVPRRAAQPSCIRRARRTWPR